MWDRAKAVLGKLWNNMGSVMRPSQKFTIIKNIRTATVLGIGTLGVLATSFLVANGLRNEAATGAMLSSLAATALGVTLLGLLVTALFCLLVFHAFYFFESTTLPQAIRLNEAMRMLHAKTNKESLAALKYYRINVFRAKDVLGEDVEKNVRCKLISTFLAPWAFRSDQNAAFGSENHCCDFEHIQQIITDNKAKWGGIPEEPSGDTSVDIAVLDRKIADLQEKNKEVTQKYTAATGRESQSKKRLAEVESHMAVLVELASKISNEVKPPQSVTEKEVRAKYLAIGKIYGITEAPGAYVEIFRKNMPKDIINWGGAPNQGAKKEKT